MQARRIVRGMSSWLVLGDKVRPQFDRLIHSKGYDKLTSVFLQSRHFIENDTISTKTLIASTLMYQSPGVRTV